MQETPYNLTYGVEAMIPVEVAEPTIRRQMFDLTLNEESLTVNLDLVSEFRDKRRIQEVACKTGVKEIQDKSLAEELPEGRPCLENAQQREKKRREVLVQLGGTFSSLRSRKEGRLSLRVAFGQNSTEDVECHAPQVLLHMNLIKSRTLSSPYQGVLMRRFHQSTSTVLPQPLDSVRMKP